MTSVGEDLLTSKESTQLDLHGCEAASRSGSSPVWEVLCVPRGCRLNEGFTIWPEDLDCLIGVFRILELPAMMHHFGADSAIDEVLNGE